MKSGLIERAEQYARQGRVKEAIRLLRKAIRRGHTSLESYLRLADLYSQIADWNQAIWALRHAHNIAPHSEPIREQLVEALLNGRQYEEAIAVCQNWLRDSPDHPIPLENLLDAYIGKRDYARALAIANQLVCLQPFSPRYRMQRARLLQRLGRSAEAAEDYRWLVFDSGINSLEVLIFARTELERLDREQLDLLLYLILDDSEFRVRFLQSPVEAVRERGFRFSPVGEAILEELPETVRTTLPNKRRYAPYC